MLPTLFHIGPIPIHSYGFLLALSFILGTLLAGRRAEKIGIPKAPISDMAALGLITGVVGSRLAYVIVHFDEFRGNLISIINPVQPDGTIGISGLILLGGVIPAVIAGAIYLNYKKLPKLLVFDAAMPSVPLGIAITRIGCFLNGCCHGKPSSLPFPFGFDFSPYKCAAGYEQLHLKAHA
ncbi:MAG: prolipoprotein diacylglyceryl transferase family protein, partial [bacterium]